MKKQAAVGSGGNSLWNGDTLLQTTPIANRAAAGVQKTLAGPVKQNAGGRCQPPARENSNAISN
ncbi:MAG: hypothetical protein ABMA26_12225, partial [Limisphaerales bacterium]